MTAATEGGIEISEPDNIEISEPDNIEISEPDNPENYTGRFRLRIPRRPLAKISSNPANQVLTFALDL